MYDVIIAGAGPVGLFLACELGLAGSSVLVLERDPQPDPAWRGLPLGMRGMSAASVEAFHRRGLLSALTAALGDQPAGWGGGRTAAAYPGHPGGRAEQERPGAEQERPKAEPEPPGAEPERPGRLTLARSAGHFAGIIVDADLVATADPWRLPTGLPPRMMTSLAAMETVLAGWAAELGVRIRRGAGVTAVTAGDDEVLVRAGDEEFRGRWLVGCDGGRSAVRRLAGFAFTGTEPMFTGYTMHATLADPAALQPGFRLTPTGMYLQTPMPGHYGFMDFDGGRYDRSQPLTREHLQEVLRRVSGTGVTLREVHHASSFTDRAMQATTYRQGRVLLAGDAAHIHSPLGGQGLNLGLGDAMNLGWKLAATVRGQAPAGLLDTYTAERHPVGARVLDWSRAQVAVMQPGSHAAALQGFVRELLGTSGGATVAAEQLSGLAIRYPVGDDHPLSGRNAPDLVLDDGTRLGELLRAGRAVLLDLTPDGRLEAAAKGWGERLRHVAGTAVDPRGLTALLVRPDGVVAWAGDDLAGFVRSATRWLGAPAQ